MVCKVGVYIYNYCDIEHSRTGSIIIIIIAQDANSVWRRAVHSKTTV